jgi:hypothetical protein
MKIFVSAAFGAAMLAAAIEFARSTAARSDIGVYGIHQTAVA